jgi:NTE family protein
MKRIAVFSGGGADGAFTVGRLSKLNKKYDGAVCVSTGALMGILAILRKWSRLEKAYNVEQENITEKNPFRKNGKLKAFNLIWTVITGSKTLGNSEVLKNHIDQSITESDWIQAKKYEIKVGVHSLTYDENVFISNQFVCFEDFKEWIWVSANAPLIMSLADKKRPKSKEVEQWTDGGVTEGTPIEEACFMAGKGGEVDVYLHKPEAKRVKNPRVENFVKYGVWFIKRLFKNVNNQDIVTGLYAAEKIGCKVTLYYMPKEYFNNPFIFNKEKMNTLFKKGVENYNLNSKIYDFRK